MTDFGNQRSQPITDHGLDSQPGEWIVEIPYTEGRVLNVRVRIALILYIIYTHFAQ